MLYYLITTKRLSHKKFLQLKYQYSQYQLTDSGESVIKIGGNTGPLTDSGESVMRIGGIIGQLTDLGESVMRIGGNTGQLTDSG